MQQPAPILPSEDRQRLTVFLLMFHDDCLSSPLILLFSDGSFSQDRKSTTVTIHNAAKFKMQLVGLPLHLLFRQVDQHLKERS